jgi:C-5 cytosine-specific DNA methylase
MKPLCIDLFCGLGGWADGFLEEGYDVVGFDIERHDYGTGGYPGQLVLQDVHTLHGSQFRRAAVIVASPPCTDYAKWGMRMFHPNPPQPDKSLWEAAVRIGKESRVPLIVENVRGAQYFWGRAQWKCGPYHLWGHLPALWPDIPLKRKNVVDDVKNGVRRGLSVSAQFPSHSDRRRECTARAAKIPFPLAYHIARVFKPV